MLALDVGTSSVRAILHDARGEPLADGQARTRWEPEVGRDGAAEAAAEELLDIVLDVLDRVLGDRRQTVAAVAVSTFWHGLMGLRGGRPCTPVWLWSDTRSWRAARRLRSHPQAEAVRQRTGCPIHPSYWTAKLAWAGPRSAERWCGFGDFLYLRLFGELGTSLSMASGTGLCSLREPGWDPGVLDLVGVREAQLPPIREWEEGLRPEFARRWPQLRDAVWLHASGDGALANLGSGCVEPALRAVTIGTSAAERVVTTRLPRRLPGGLWCYRLDARRYVMGGAFSSGGNFHAWVMDSFRVERDELERQLQSMRPAQHGLVCVPHLAGERSPGYAPRAAGALAGLTLATTGADVARAGMEAIAMDFARVDARLDGAAPGAELLVGSGAALLASPAWAQMLADCVGRPLVLSHHPEATARGAAVFALEHLGIELERERPAGRTFTPDPGARAAYRKAMRRQAALYRAVTGGPLAEAGPTWPVRSWRRKGSNGG